MAARPHALDASPYARLDADAARDSFEVWQFRRSFALHNVLVAVTALLYLAAAWAAKEEHIAGVAVAIMICVSIAARTAVHASEHEAAGRRWCIAIFVGLSVAGACSDARILAGSTAAWHVWIGYVATYSLYGPLGAVICNTLAIQRWAFVLLSALWMALPGACIVAQSRAPQGESIADTQWLVGLVLFASWAVGVAIYVPWDSQSRQLHLMMQQNSDLANAKSRCACAACGTRDRSDFGLTVQRVPIPCARAVAVCVRARSQLHGGH